MGKKKQKRNKRAKQKKRQVASQLPRTEGEEPRAEAVTVAWTLSMVATLLAEGAAIVVWLVHGSESRGNEIVNVPALLLFTAIVAGAVCLLLTPATHYVRRRPPPLAVTIFAVVVSLAPWLLRAVLR